MLVECIRIEFAGKIAIQPHLLVVGGTGSHSVSAGSEPQVVATELAVRAAGDSVR